MSGDVKASEASAGGSEREVERAGGERRRRGSSSLYFQPELPAPPARCSSSSRAHPTFTLRLHIQGGCRPDQGLNAAANCPPKPARDGRDKQKHERIGDADRQEQGGRRGADELRLLAGWHGARVFACGCLRTLVVRGARRVHTRVRGESRTETTRPLSFRESGRRAVLFCRARAGRVFRPPLRLKVTHRHAHTHSKNLPSPSSHPVVLRGSHFRLGAPFPPPPRLPPFTPAITAPPAMPPRPAGPVCPQPPTVASPHSGWPRWCCECGGQCVCRCECQPRLTWRKERQSVSVSHVRLGGERDSVTTPPDPPPSCGRPGRKAWAAAARESPSLSLFIRRNCSPRHADRAFSSARHAQAMDRVRPRQQSA